MQPPPNLLDICSVFDRRSGHRALRCVAHAPGSQFGSPPSTGVSNRGVHAFSGRPFSSPRSGDCLLSPPVSRWLEPTGGPDEVPDRRGAALPKLRRHIARNRATTKPLAGFGADLVDSFLETVRALPRARHGTNLILGTRRPSGSTSPPEAVREVPSTSKRRVR